VVAAADFPDERAGRPYQGFQVVDLSDILLGWEGISTASLLKRKLAILEMMFVRDLEFACDSHLEFE
jgi:hypothetical protein